MMVYPMLAQAVTQPKKATTQFICSDTADRFGEWKSAARARAVREGMSPKTAKHLFAERHHSDTTIARDRKMVTSPPVSFKDYLDGLSSSEIIAQGIALKKANSRLLINLKKEYGVPPGILMALWGLETHFGETMGKTPLLSTLATLAYDCRRAKFFTEQFFYALDLVKKGVISSHALGATFGEIGQFQFLPVNVVKYAIDADEDGKIDLVKSNIDAIASAAKFLAKLGWTKCAGYQPGEKNFAILKHWNASLNYNKTIAYIAAHIDGVPIGKGYDT